MDKPDNNMKDQQESLHYLPDPDLLETLHVPDYQSIYEESIHDPERFWGKIAEDFVWTRKWDRVLEWNPQNYEARWFPGSLLNITTNMLDRHIEEGLANKVALIAISDDGNERIYTYGRIMDEVNRLCHSFAEMGLQKGDRVTIFLPPTPEQVISMIACARSGLVHTVVFSGFSAGALKSRMEDSEPRLLITADCAYRRGKRIALLDTAREARAAISSLLKTIVIRRENPDLALADDEIPMDLLMKKHASSGFFKAVDCTTDDPLFILYTSGTTGKPKGIVHTHPGYMVGTFLTTRWVFNLHHDDVFFCVADPGWITGHSYIVYGPLLNGATVLLAEGSPDYPDPGRWWHLVEKYRVTVFYSTPTAIRLQMRLGKQWPQKYDLSSLRLLGSVGEPINPEAWLWFRDVTGGRLPIMDTWWQTETGMHMITPLPGVPLVPGSATRPFPGVIADVVNRQGESVGPGEAGFVIIRKPWPSMFRTVYKDPERYRKYWEEIPGVYFSGDSARRDSNGLFHMIGRVDDVIKVAGHRLGTAEIESALVSHPSVSEAAVIGKPDDLKGEVIKAFVILRKDAERTSDLELKIRQHVREELGAIAMPDEIEITEWLPRTRSGKIMRRVLKARELGLPEGDTSTLED